MSRTLRSKNRRSPWTHARILRSLLRTEERCPSSNNADPVRHVSDDPVKDDRELLSHVRWMLSAIPVLVEGGRRDKSLRWLGFVQGVMWAKGWVTISDLRDCNREEIPYDLEVDDLVIMASDPSSTFRVTKISHGYNPGTGLAFLVTEDGSSHGWEDIQILRKK